jgi:probable addiction module antidote protein
MVEIRKTDLFAQWLDALRDLHFTMTKTVTSRYDVAEHLRTPEEMAAYLEACLEEADGDAAFIAKALGDIARAKGMSQVARDAGLSRESLYKALSGDRSPGFDTILKVIGALGLKLHAEAGRG